VVSVGGKGVCCDCEIKRWAGGDAKAYTTNHNQASRSRERIGAGAEIRAQAEGQEKLSRQRGRCCEADREARGLRVLCGAGSARCGAGTAGDERRC
jgi:hypothetical protein